MEKKHYETTFLVTPGLSGKMEKEIKERYTKFLKEQKTEIIHWAEAPHRKLAYPVKKQVHAIYQTVEFIAAPEVIEKLEVCYRRDEHILRFLTVCLDKKEADYRKQRRAVPLAKTNLTTE